MLHKKEIFRVALRAEDNSRVHNHDDDEKHM
jgi:hypothetical protein